MFGNQGNATVLELYFAPAHHLDIEVLQDLDDGQFGVNTTHPLGNANPGTLAKRHECSGIIIAILLREAFGIIGLGIREVLCIMVNAVQEITTGVPFGMTWLVSGTV